jgi:mono/diheme cytochrome c family protein
VNCHGEDGKGKREGTPDFTSAEWQSKESDEELTEQIKKGDPPKMPAFESKLNEDQIKALVAYVRSFAK